MPVDVNSALVDKLVALEMRLERERGSFVLFALLARQDASGSLDLVVSSRWLTPEKKTDLEDMVTAVKAALSSEEMLQLSAVVILPINHPVVQHINTAFRAHHVAFGLHNIGINGLHITHGVVITSQRPEPGIVA